MTELAIEGSGIFIGFLIGYSVFVFIISIPVTLIILCIKKTFMMILSSLQRIGKNCNSKQ